MSEPQHFCKDCALYFNTKESLDVHLQYHKENLLSKWTTSENNGEESNNNVKPNKSPKMIVPGKDSSDKSSDRCSPITFFNTFYLPPNMRQQQAGQGARPNPNFNNSNTESDFILGSGAEFPRRNSPNSPQSQNPSMQNASFQNPPMQYPIDCSPLYNFLPSHCAPPDQPYAYQCHKCGLLCDNSVVLYEHLQNTHPEDFGFNNDFYTPPETKQTNELLNLDSHKLLTASPPVCEDVSKSRHLNPDTMIWTNIPEKKDYFNLNMNGGGIASRHDYNAPSFQPPGMVLYPPEMTSQHHGMAQQQLYHYDHNINPPNHLHAQIPAQLPPPSPKPAVLNIAKNSNNASWKSNEARRPKTYNCTACNKWFTSSGHLKRHYNTTLHKNAVKQSGVPDPANAPVSSHHHPTKDSVHPYHRRTPPEHRYNRRSPPENPYNRRSPPENPYNRHTPPENPYNRHTPPELPYNRGSPPDNNHMPSNKIEEVNYDGSQNHLRSNGNNYLNPPNSLAGPSEITGGLLPHHSLAQHNMDSRYQHQSYQMPIQEMQTTTYSQDGTIYPNLQPPHVSSQQVITSNNTGNFNVMEQKLNPQQSWSSGGDIKNQLVSIFAQEPLPSFYALSGYMIPNDNGKASHSNVGGPSAPEVSNFKNERMDYQTEEHHNSMSSEMPLLINKLSLVTTEDVEQKNYSCPSSIDNTQSLVNTNYEVDQGNSDCLQSLNENSNSISSVQNNRSNSTTPDSGISLEDDAEKVTQIKCHDCGKLFNKACYLTQHNKTLHTGEKPFKCEICGKKYEHEHQYQEHRSKHLGEKPFKCELCTKSFHHKTDLNRHITQHTGTKPYKCNVCGKGFIRKDHMMKHCETHKRATANLQTEMKALFTRFPQTPSRLA